jgi:hypothetical protein
MPALRKCDVGTFAPDGILDGHLPIIFGAILDPFLDPFFEARWRDDLPVYRRFLCLGQRLGPLFRPLLVPLLDRVSGHFGTRLCSPPHLNCSDVCLTIRHKSSHPLRVRSVAK